MSKKYRLIATRLTSNIKMSISMAMEKIIIKPMYQLSKTLLTKCYKIKKHMPASKIVSKSIVKSSILIPNSHIPKK